MLKLRIACDILYYSLYYCDYNHFNKTQSSYSYLNWPQIRDFTFVQVKIIDCDFIWIQFCYKAVSVCYDLYYQSLVHLYKLYIINFFLKAFHHSLFLDLFYQRSIGEQLF